MRQLLALVGLLLLVPLTISAQLVRTADATVRGLRETDFPRIVKLADDVYAYEDLNGDLKGNLAFTTNSLIVITTEGVVVVDGQGSVAKKWRIGRLIWASSNIGTALRTTCPTRWLRSTPSWMED